MKLGLVVLSIGLLGQSSAAGAGEIRHPAVGNWYTEFTITNKADPLASQYDSWKALSRRLADGRHVVHFRFYKNATAVSDMTETSSWGVDGRTYWTQCISYVQDGAQKSCSHRSEYSIDEITDSRMTYTSRKTGRIYRVQRVSEEFKLP